MGCWWSFDGATEGYGWGEGYGYAGKPGPKNLAIISSSPLIQLWVCFYQSAPLTVVTCQSRDDKSIQKDMVVYKKDNFAPF